MPGPYSSASSVADALSLAGNLGIAHHTIDINSGNRVLLKALKGCCPAGGDGIMEEDIQSRLRGTLVMAVANRHGAMALTTGNKSEIAVGYCTIYGDMNGRAGADRRPLQDHRCGSSRAGATANAR